MERDEYVRTVVDFLELLPPDCVVERVHGDAPADYLVGPAWCLDRIGLRQALEAEFLRRDTWQGKAWRRQDSGQQSAVSDQPSPTITRRLPGKKDLKAEG